MADLKDMVQKAFYLGMGLATYTSEKAKQKLLEFQAQAQKLADELVRRGTMSTEEARQWVEDLTRQASANSPSETSASEPRKIEILIEESNDSGTNAEEVERLRQQMLELQAELHRLQKK